MAIRNQTELRTFLERFELNPNLVAEVVGSAIFQQSKCLGMFYGPLAMTLSFAQFDKLLKELNVSMSIGGNGQADHICRDAYPGQTRCGYKAEHFCNITALGGTAEDCPQSP